MSTPVPPEDRALDAYLQRPGRRCLARVVRVLHAHVWRVALRVTGNEEDAADVCQDVFVSLLLDPPAAGSVRSARGYLAARAVTVARNRRRAGERRRAREAQAARRLEEERCPAPGGAGSAAERLLSAEDVDALHAAIEELPERVRTVVELRYLGDLRNQDIARALDVSERTVEADLHEGRELLRARLAGAVWSAVVLAAGSGLAEAGTPPPEVLEGLLRVVRMGDALAPLVHGAAGGAAATAPSTSKTAALLASLAAILLVAALVGIRVATRMREVSGPASSPVAAKALPDAMRAPGRVSPRSATEVTAGAGTPVGGQVAGWALTGRVVRIPADDEASRPPAELPGPAPVAASGGSDGPPAPVPVEGAAVRLRLYPEGPRWGEPVPEDAQAVAAARTGADGRFHLAGASASGWVELGIDEPSSASVRMLLSGLPRLPEASRESTRDLGDLMLEPPTELRVRVVGPRDEAVDDGWVAAYPEVHPDNRHLETIFRYASCAHRDLTHLGAGLYGGDRMPPRKCTVAIEAPGYEPRLAEVEPISAEPPLIELREARRIGGVVRDAVGEPVGGAWVELVSFGACRAQRRRLADAGGRFLFESVCGGDGETYRLEAGTEGFAAARLEGVRPDDLEVEVTLIPEAVLAGVVLDEEGRPIEGALVWPLWAVSPLARTSRADGSFEVRGLPADTYEVRATHPEFAPPAAPTIELRAGERVDGLELRMARGLRTTVLVLDSRSEAPIEGAEVRHAQPPEEIRKDRPPGGVTGPDGTVELRGLRQGEVVVSATAEGYLAAEEERTAEISTEGPREVRIALERGGTISGRVLDAEGRAVARASVRVRAERKPPSGAKDERVEEFKGRDVTSDRDGRYRVPGLPERSDYAVIATDPDHVPALVRGVAVGPGGDMEGLDLRLSRGAAARGRVVDEWGAGVAGARLKARPEDPPGGRSPEEKLRFDHKLAGWTATADWTGAFEVAHLLPGGYRLDASLPGSAASAKRRLEVEGERAVEGVDFVLRAGLTLTGVVVDSRGEPVPRAEVYGPGCTSTDREGRFRIGGLLPGEYELVVRKDRLGEARAIAPAPGPEVRVVILRLGRISGRVLVPGGAPHEGSDWSRVVAAPRGATSASDPPASGIAGDGSFELDLPPGTYVLEATVPEHAPTRSAEMSVGENEWMRGVEIALEPAGRIVATVVLAGSGEPVAGAWVSATSADGLPALGDWSSSFEFPTTGTDGRHAIENLAAGSYEVAASHDSHGRGRARGVRVRTGETVEARIELRPGGRIRGAVRRRDLPAEGATVSWRRLGSTAGTADAEVGAGAPEDILGIYHVQADGAYETPHLEPGRYLIEVSTLELGRGAGARLEVAVEEGREVAADLALRSVWLRGRVRRLGEGAGHAAVEVSQVEPSGPAGAERLAPSGSAGRFQVATDEDGRYALELPGPGFWRIAASKDGRSASETVVVPEAPEMEKDLELPGE